MRALRSVDDRARRLEAPRLHAVVASPAADERPSFTFFRKLAGQLRRAGVAGLGERTGDTPAGSGRGVAVAAGDTMLVRCAWCGCFRTGTGWRVVAPVPADGRISHGICPRCFRAVARATGR